jgi:hypothetical protein
MDCVTPSNPNPIPSGESLDIYQLLEKLDIDIEAAVQSAFPPEINDITGFDQEYWERPSQLLPGPNIEWIENQLSKSSASKKQKSAPIAREKEKMTRKKVSKVKEIPIKESSQTAPITRPPETRTKYTCDEITNLEL